MSLCLTSPLCCVVPVCVWKVPPFNPFFSHCSFQMRVLCLIWLHPLTFEGRKPSKFNICLLALSHLCLGFHPKGKVNPRKLAEKIPFNTKADISYMKVCTESLLFQSSQHWKISLNCYHSWTKIDFFFFLIFCSPTEYSDVVKPRDTQESTWVCFLAVLEVFVHVALFCWLVGAVCYCRQCYRRGLCEQAAVTWRWKNLAVLFASHLLQLQYQSSL